MSALAVAIPMPAPAPSAAAPPVPPPAPRGAQWLDSATAAERMGVSPRRIAQLCAGRWSREGLARRDGAGGAWKVRDDADPLLARVKPPELLPFDWSTLTSRQRRALQDRKRVLDAWDKARAAGLAAGMTVDAVTDAFLAQLEADQGVRITAGTLYRMYRRWRCEGFAGLVDGRWQPPASLVRRVYEQGGHHVLPPTPPPAFLHVNPCQSTDSCLSSPQGEDVLPLDAVNP